jgi:allantoinase
MPNTLLLRSKRVVAGGVVRPGAVLVREERIEALLPHDAAPDGAEVRDFGDLALMAGLVDSHVHVNEPGRTEWEGFETATEAARHGGVTTIVDMPLNCIPVTTSAEALATKLAAIEGKLKVDAAFWGGVVPGNAGELEGMAKLGARGFKAFMCHSGIDDFPRSREEDLRAAMKVLAGLGLPLLLHAELCESRSAPDCADVPRSYGQYLASRPGDWEVAAVELAIKLCRETGCRAHIVHLSESEALRSIVKAKTDGLPLTAETCPHYLTFASEEIPDGLTEYKCAPPIRGRENRERLWEALKAGALDMIVSDHSPCAPELKKRDAGDFSEAWGGIAGLQFTLPAAWTGLRARGGSLPELTRLVCAAPARLAGLPRKGELAAGRDADLVAWDPEADFVVEPELIRHRHKLTPYSGRALRGKVHAVVLRGRIIHEQGAPARPPSGRALSRPEDHEPARPARPARRA